MGYFFVSSAFGINNPLIDSRPRGLSTLGAVQNNQTFFDGAQNGNRFANDGVLSPTYVPPGTASIGLPTFIYQQCAVASCHGAADLPFTYGYLTEEQSARLAVDATLTVGSVAVSGGTAALLRGAKLLAVGRVGKPSNPVPGELARVIAGEGKFTNLGLLKDKDVFVAAADDIVELNSAQLAKRLAIPAAETFTVIRFPTPATGVASPIRRTNPGFLQGGRTRGGAREFVIPNGPIPPGSTIEVVGP